jgi:PLP dependent protein
MILDNIKILEERISEVCESCGRKRSEIKLIGVSKTQPVSLIQEVIDAGIKDLGENKAQELRDKSGLLKGDFNWHFIGHLQTNKIKYLIDAAKFIHSVDSIKLAEEINRKAAQINKKQNVLLEIKTSDEATKFGLSNDKEIFEVAEYCKLAENLILVGLMTMAPFTGQKDDIRKSFKSLRELKDRMNAQGFGLTDLSMGMTSDYEIAIEEGSTMLRIGTAIFGERIYH